MHRNSATMLCCVLCSTVMFRGAALAAETSDLDERLDMIQAFQQVPGILMPYKANYFLPVTYMTDPNQASLEELGIDDDYNDVEAKFQLSFIVPLWRDLGKDNLDLYFAYTQVAFWQVYNVELSQLFRDVNYRPEAFLFLATDYEFFGLNGSGIMAGYLHESNGRGTQVLTRTWDRVYLNFLFSKGDFALSVMPWLRVSNDSENRDIDDYMGNFELRATYWGEKNEFSLMLRNNFDFDEDGGAIELGWSRPLSKHIRGYLQYFNGYGESLLDYNYRNERLGIGILLNRTPGVQ